MWSQQTLDNYIKKIILTRPETNLLREPVLLIIDSYGPHIIMANSKKFEKWNVFIKIIPPNLTGILQPLDVVINKTFQESYNTLYDSYISEAIQNPNLQSKSGNPKIPSYEMISNWVSDWYDNITIDIVQRAFIVCGVIPKEFFDIEKLHEPLKQLFEYVDMDEWAEQFSNIIFPIDNFFETSEICEWFFPESTSLSLFECIKKIDDDGRDDYSEWFENFCQMVIYFLQIESEVDMLFDEDDKKRLENGRTVGNEIELYAISKIKSYKTQVIELNEKCEKVGETVYNSSGENEIVLIKLDSFYALKINF